MAAGCSAYGTALEAPPGLSLELGKKWSRLAPIAQYKSRRAAGCTGHMDEI